MKKVGIIIISALLALLLIVVSVNSLSKSSKKGSTQPTNVVQSSQTQQNSHVQSNQVQNNNTQNSNTQASANITATEIPATPKAEVGDLDKGASLSEEEVITMTELNLDTVPYKNKYITESCSISDKKAYFSDNQIYYSVKIYLKEVDKTIDYYVGYSTYNALKVNDKITVEYESFDNGIVSITSISNR